MVTCQVSVKVDLFFKNILNICILSTDQLSKTVLPYWLYKQVQMKHCVMGFPWVIIAKATPSLNPSYRHMSITPAARFHTWRTRYWYFHPIQNSEMIRKRCKSLLICFILVTSFFLTQKKRSHKVNKKLWSNELWTIVKSWIKGVFFFRRNEKWIWPKQNDFFFHPQKFFWAYGPILFKMRIILLKYPATGFPMILAKLQSCGLFIDTLKKIWYLYFPFSQRSSISSNTQGKNQATPCKVM